MWCVICLDRPAKITTNRVPHCTHPNCIAYVRRQLISRFNRKESV